MPPTAISERIEHIFRGNGAKKNICPVKDILARLGDKWSIYSVLLLGQHEKMRFNELKTRIKGISQRMLTVTLRSLEEDGIVSRTIYSEIPPRVEYALTDLGKGLLLQLIELASWADINFEQVTDSRKRFELRTHKEHV